MHILAVFACICNIKNVTKCDSWFVIKGRGVIVAGSSLFQDNESLVNTLGSSCHLRSTKKHCFVGWAFVSSTLSSLSCIMKLILFASWNCYGFTVSNARIPSVWPGSSRFEPTSQLIEKMAGECCARQTPAVKHATHTCAHVIHCSFSSSAPSFSWQLYVDAELAVYTFVPLPLKSDSRGSNMRHHYFQDSFQRKHHLAQQRTTVWTLNWRVSAHNPSRFLLRPTLGAKSPLWSYKLTAQVSLQVRSKMLEKCESFFTNKLASFSPELDWCARTWVQLSQRSE